MKLKKGFTLVELLIGIFIVGILLSYAIPSYKRQVIVSKRTQAHNTIMMIAAFQETHNAIYNQFAETMEDATASESDLGLASAEFRNSTDYDYILNTNTITGYAITAKAKGSQLNDIYGIDCTSISYNSLGQKTPISCWQ